MDEEDVKELLGGYMGTIGKQNEIIKGLLNDLVYLSGLIDYVLKQNTRLEEIIHKMAGIDKYTNG